MLGERVGQLGVERRAARRAQDQRPFVAIGPDRSGRARQQGERALPCLERDGRAIRGCGKRQRQRCERCRPGQEMSPCPHGHLCYWTAVGLSRESEPSIAKAPIFRASTAFSTARVCAIRPSIASWTILLPSALPSPIIWSYFILPLSAVSLSTRSLTSAFAIASFTPLSASGDAAATSSDRLAPFMTLPSIRL